MTIGNAAGEEYFSVRGARFMSGVCFIAPSSEDADAPSREFITAGSDLLIPASFYGSPIRVAGHELLANKPSTATC